MNVIFLSYKYSKHFTSSTGVVINTNMANNKPLVSFSNSWKPAFTRLPYPTEIYIVPGCKHKHYSIKAKVILITGAMPYMCIYNLFIKI